MGATRGRRTCAGCRAARERGELIRLSLDSEGRLTLSRPGAPGRGTYVCPSAACLAEACDRKLFGRFLRRPGVRVEREALMRELQIEIRRRHSRAGRPPAPPGTVETEPGTVPAR